MGDDERTFSTFRRGQVRDDIVLAYYRASLASSVNPETGTVFTSDEIQRATQPGSRFYREADAIDVLGMAQQAKGAAVAENLLPQRANRTFLEQVYSKLWLGSADSRLAAVGAGGTGQFVAETGAIFPGSTTLGDPTAAVASDPNGNLYQVLEEVTVKASDNKTVNLPMRAIDTGTTTNIDADTLLTWVQNQPLTAQSSGKALTDFEGGFDVETDAELADRIGELIRFRPANGNAAHFMAWAREASVAVERAFVYPCCLDSGSTVVCILQKRQESLGPMVRAVPAEATLYDCTRYLVPPDSPVAAERAYTVVTQANPQSSNVAVRISMGQGRIGGWYDSVPWPNPSDLVEDWESNVTSVSSQTEFTVSTQSDLPGGATSLSGDDAPQIMIWDEETSRFEQITVQSVSKAGSTATIILSEAPSHTIASGDRISPFTDLHLTIATAVQNYFDELGPGEVVDIDSDSVGYRAARFPAPHERFPYRAGQAIVTRIGDALDGVSPDSTLAYMSRNEPDLPGQIIDGPNMVVLGHLTVLPL